MESSFAHKKDAHHAGELFGKLGGQNVAAVQHPVPGAVCGKNGCLLVTFAPNATAANVAAVAKALAPLGYEAVG